MGLVQDIRLLEKVGGSCGVGPPYRAPTHERGAQDVEEKRAEMEAEKERIERAKATPAIQQCSHDRSAVRRGAISPSGGNSCGAGSLTRSRSQERRLFEMSPDDQLGEIKWHKTLADAYLEEGQFGRALASYDRVRLARRWRSPTARSGGPWP